LIGREALSTLCSFRRHQHRGRGRVSAAAFYDWLFATTAAAWITGGASQARFALGTGGNARARQGCRCTTPGVEQERLRHGGGSLASARNCCESLAPDVGAERSFVGFRGSHRPFGTPDSNLLRSLASSTQRATFRSRTNFLRDRALSTSSDQLYSAVPNVLRPQRPPVVGEGDPAIIQSRKRIFFRVIIVSIVSPPQPTGFYLPTWRMRLLSISSILVLLVFSGKGRHGQLSIRNNFKRFCICGGEGGR